MLQDIDPSLIDIMELVRAGKLQEAKERIKNKRKLEIQDFKSKSDFPNTGCLIDLDNKEEKKHFIINVKTD